MKHTNRWKQAALAASIAAAGALLAACGGSSNDDALDGVPASAQESSDSFASYLGDLTELDSDRREPFAIDNAFVAPTSDTTEPVPVDG